MALTSDIVESWRHPRAVVRRLRGAGRSEPFVFTFLLVFLLLAFTALAPYLARQATLHPEVALPQRLFGAALGLLALIPLFYLLAALGHLVARLMGGTGLYYDGRLALFWALTCITPAMLGLGLVRALLGDGLAVTGLGVAVFFGFIALYSVMLREVEGQ
jgi:hypothetical protein